MALLSVKNLTAAYHTASGPLRAVDSVGFELERSVSLGIAGESGCGKSTLMLALLNLLERCDVTGEITFDGIPILHMPEDRFRSLRWRRIAVIPQASMGALNPVYTIGWQIAEAILHHTGMGKAQARQKTAALLESVGVDGGRARNYPHELSGGMCQRAMIAMAMALGPDLILADEPTTALDSATQVQILKLMQRIKREQNASIIYVSHNLSVIGQVCEQIIIMYAGKFMEIGPSSELFRNPLHPYTAALLASCPDIRSAEKRMAGLSGSPPDLWHMPAGCRFHPRCPRCTELCRTREPEMAEIGPGRFAACHYAKAGCC